MQLTADIIGATAALLGAVVAFCLYLKGMREYSRQNTQVRAQYFISMRKRLKNNRVLEDLCNRLDQFPIQLRACLFALLGFISRLLSVSINIGLSCAHSSRLVPPVRWLLVICVCFPSISYASSSPSNDMHFCEVLDYEDILARDSLYAATKQALNLNVGEPRTVRMIYFCRMTVRFSKQ